MGRRGAAWGNTYLYLYLFPGLGGGAANIFGMGWDGWMGNFRIRIRIRRICFGLFLNVVYYSYTFCVVVLYVDKREGKFFISFRFLLLGSWYTFFFR